MNKKSAAINPIRSRKDIIFYFTISLIALAFSFFINEDVNLPQYIIRPLGILGFAFIFISAFSKPLITFLVLVIYIPFSKILVGDFGTMATGLNFTNVLIFMSAIGWFSQAAKGHYKIFEKSTLTFPVLAFIAWGIFSSALCAFEYGSVYFDNFIIPLKRWLTPVILYFIALNMVKDRDSLKKVISTMMFVILIIALMAVRDYIDVGGGNFEDSRIGGVFEQPNTIGGFFVYNIFLFLGFFLAYFPDLRYGLFLIPFLICFRGIMVTFSRGAYVGFAFGAMALTFFRSKVVFIASIALLIFALLNPVFLPAGIRYRMESTFHSETVFSTDIEEIKDKSATRRIDVWKGAIEMIKEHPLFGVGYGLFPNMIASYADVGSMDAHNTYLILAAEMGIPALVIFLLIIFIMVKNARWLYRKSEDKFIRAFALGMLGGLFGLLMVNMFGSRLNSEEVSAYFWIYAGLIMATVNMKRKGIIS